MTTTDTAPLDKPVKPTGTITNHVDQLISHVDDIHGTLMEVRPILRSAGLVSRFFGRR